MSDAELERLATEYLKDNTTALDVLEHRAAILYEFLEGEVDSDVLSVLLECDGAEAARILVKLREPS